MQLCGEADIEGETRVQGHPGLCSEFGVSLAYIAGLCLKKSNQGWRDGLEVKSTGCSLPEVLSSIPSNYMVSHKHLQWI